MKLFRNGKRTVELKSGFLFIKLHTWPWKCYFLTRRVSSSPVVGLRWIHSHLKILAPSLFLTSVKKRHDTASQSFVIPAVFPPAI
mmetsp:Transcript_16776/g.43210  ORF Transcript_16776/g.43210 Transcript_16776/m.43210 type:complete len:85 (+) Transcript_16776:230-484(+)